MEPSQEIPDFFELGTMIIVLKETLVLHFLTGNTLILLKKKFFKTYRRREYGCAVTMTINIIELSFRNGLKVLSLISFGF